MHAETIYDQLVLSLSEALTRLENLRMHDPADMEIVRLKRDLRNKIKEIRARMKRDTAA